jgi:hypothetical protein
MYISEAGDVKKKTPQRTCQYLEANEIRSIHLSFSKKFGHLGLPKHKERKKNMQRKFLEAAMLLVNTGVR